MDYALHTFANGIRLVHKQIVHSRIAHCGFVLDVGSRDELPGQEGIAHFWEHMAFKGTERRKAFHILNRLESVGGELNAYTTKEKIVFHASVLDAHFGKAAELLTDITFGSTFPERELEKEREVILEEMSSYKDAPEDAIFDEFDQVMFPGHPLGVNILGTPESVAGFKRKDFRTFLDRTVDTSRIIFASVSRMPMAKVVKMMERYLANIPARAGKVERTTPTVYVSQKLSDTRPASQAHCLIGRPSYSLMHPQRLPFFMLTNVLGGPGANSRLNLALRERHGYVYGVEAGYTPFLDTGAFSIYFATDPKRLGKARDLVRKELKTLRTKPLGTMQLHLAKEQLMGQLAMAEESNAGMMQVLGKSILDIGRLETISELFTSLRAVTAHNLMEVAEEMLGEDQMSELVYMPEEE